MAPELQPTSRSGRSPSAARTSAIPSAATLRTPPLPNTKASRKGFDAREAIVEFTMIDPRNVDA
jgi:hypothetical protein